MNKLINFDNVIYGLAKYYGFKLDIYNVTETVDFSTGQATQQRIKVKIKKAIVLPNQLYRDFKYGALNSGQYQFGGIVDLQKRGVLIKRNSLPKNFVLDENSYVIFNDERYDVSDRQTLEAANYIFFTIKKVEGIPLLRIFDNYIEDRLPLTEEITNVTN